MGAKRLRRRTPRGPAQSLAERTASSTSKARTAFVSHVGTVRRSCDVRKHLAVMAVPVALQAFGRIVLFLEPQELGKSRVTLLDLLAGRPAVIRQVIPPAVLDR